MKIFLFFVSGFWLLCFSFSSLAVANEPLGEVPKQDAGETYPERLPPKQTSLPPRFPCTNNQLCPCLEGRCPYGYTCGESQQCEPRSCTTECPGGFTCSNGKCVGVTPCWGALCAKEEICVQQNNIAECRQLCGDSICPDEHICINKQCVGKDKLCNQEGQTRDCEVSCDYSSMNAKGKQLCSGGVWQICQQTETCTHVDCNCEATVYCTEGKIYQTQGGFRLGDAQGRCWCEEKGDFVAYCEGSCSKELEGKRFSTSEKTQQSLCSNNKTSSRPFPTKATEGCGCQATPHPTSLLSMLLFGVFFFLKRRRI